MNKVTLWKCLPDLHKRKQDGLISSKNVFPSARQAISHCLGLAGVGRINRIAVPEWSSACVISSVASKAMPIPITEVLEHALNIDGILLYYQWGWPLGSQYLQKILDKFPDAIIVLDKVDVPSMVEQNQNICQQSGNVVIEIWSLSKILGLPCGGIAKINRIFVDRSEALSCDEIMQTLNNNIELEESKNIIKSQMKGIPEVMHHYISEYDIELEIDIEAAKRRSNMAEIKKTGLCDDWPLWMCDVLDGGAAPGIAPLYIGESKDRLQRIRDKLDTDFNIETSIYHFNTNGDPLSPEYKPCLAFPVHSQMSKELIQSALTSSI